MRFIDPDVKGYVDYEVQQVAARVQAVQASIGNSLSVEGETIGNPGAAPASYVFQAILLTPQYTGSFLVGWSYPWNSDTNGDAVTLAVKATGWTTTNWAPIKSTGNIALAGASSILSSNGRSTGGPINGGTAPGMYQCTTPGTTITPTVTGANPSTITASSAVFPTLTALLSGQGMQWQSGTTAITFGASGWAIGSPLLIQFVVSATHTISMTGSAAFWAFELPPYFG